MPDFSEIYGKPADEMTEGEFKIAVIGFLHGIDEHLKELNGRTKCIPRHEWYFKIIGIISGTGLTAFIGWLVYNLLRYIGS